MSAKTYVPGMDDGNAVPQQEWQQFSNPYSRERGVNATYVEGMYAPKAEEPIRQPRMNPAFGRDNVVALSSLKVGKPILGFLYSVSRVASGEFWPLYQGENTIGSSTSCDICLREGTVSHDHALLLVRKNKNPEKLLALISDVRSTNGTMLNGQSLESTPRECFNGDHIIVGDNYELYLVLLDTKALNLSLAEKFVPIADVPVSNQEPNNQGTTIQSDGFPRFTGGGSYEPMPMQDGTVGIDGQVGPKLSGETIGM